MAFFLSTRLLIAYQRSNNLRLSFTQLIPQDDQDDQDASTQISALALVPRSIFLLGPDLSQKGKKTTRLVLLPPKRPVLPRCFSPCLSRRTRPRTALRHFRVDSPFRARGKSTAKRFQLRETNRDSHVLLTCDRLRPRSEPEPSLFLFVPPRLRARSDSTPFPSATEVPTCLV